MAVGEAVVEVRVEVGEFEGVAVRGGVADGTWAMPAGGGIIVAELVAAAEAAAVAEGAADGEAVAFGAEVRVAAGARVGIPI